MPRDAQLEAAIAQLRSYGAVALGAGLSAARYPMVHELRSLLWHALDSNQNTRARLAATLGVADTNAKTLLGDDEERLELGWRALGQDHQARRAFQQGFARLDVAREPTPGHYAVARLIHAGIIEYVISFNWDTALERAYEQLFGTSLVGREALVAEPHGDPADPAAAWILPNEPGAIPESVSDRMASLVAERPRVLLVVGYSGSDAAVVQQLVGPAEERWPVVRVGPTVEGPETVTGFADDVMPVLADALNAAVDMVGWRWVGFSQSRDLRAALLGYRLGPQDVLACPKPPAAVTVAQRLRQTGFAVIVGDSGAGKSITAFHAAHELHREDWAVVELSQPGVATRADVRTLGSLADRVVAVVDDAQAWEGDVIQALERAASENHAVVLVATNRSPGQELIRVSAEQSVLALATTAKDMLTLLNRWSGRSTTVSATALRASPSSTASGLLDQASTHGSSCMYSAVESGVSVPHCPISQSKTVPIYCSGWCLRLSSCR